MSHPSLHTPSHYYPYGMLFGESSSPLLARPQAWMGSGNDSYHSYGEYGNGRDKNHYKFGGKEHLTFRGVYHNDFGARLQDPALCMFTTPDPLCEETHNLHSYLYCGADPVNHIDPIGMKFVYNLTEEEITRFCEFLKMMCASKEFSQVYNFLEASSTTYVISIDSSNTENIAGCYSSETKEIILNNSNFTSGTISEEFFHAYQDNLNFLYANIEFNYELESKIFREIVSESIIINYSNSEYEDIVKKGFEKWKTGELFSWQNSFSQLTKKFRKRCNTSRYNDNHRKDSYIMPMGLWTLY